MTRKINISLHSEPHEDLRDVHGSIVEMGKDSYLIWINSACTEEEQARAFLHECAHIWRDDFNRQGLTASEIEKQVHTLLEAL